MGRRKDEMLDAKAPERVVSWSLSKMDTKGKPQPQKKVNSVLMSMKIDIRVRKTLEALAEMEGKTMTSIIEDAVVLYMEQESKGDQPDLFSSAGGG
jgi:hypothetical protein